MMGIVVNLFSILLTISQVESQDVFGCGGFVKSEVEINFSLIEVKLYTKQGSLKYQTDCAPINGYYMIPVYDKGDYVLKVEPPPGWTFDPESYNLHIDGVTDKCSKAEDINFQFTGFGVIGKVISKGQSSGPSGVSLSLKKKGKTEVLKTAISKQNGGYTFEKVIPGEYEIEATHPVWKFQNPKASVTVARETGNAGNSIAILGYDVKGQVLSDGEPIKGVKFVVYSADIKSNDVAGCEKTDIKTLKPSKGQSPLCHVASSEDGYFLFPALPSGKYRLVPIYVGEKIKFDVVPSELEFVVEHGSLTLEKPFQVAGFTVTGKVVTQPKGMGIAFAAVKVNGKQVTQTKEDGSFTLDSMKAGTYTIDIMTSDMFFDPKKVTVNPNNPELPDIIASRFAACGYVRVDKFPDTVNPDLSKRKITITEKDQPKIFREIYPERSGRFCTDLKPGFYTFRVQITPEEVKAGLKLSPVEHEIAVKPTPTREIIFSQMRAKISGNIHCLETCRPMQLTLNSIGRSDDRALIQAVVSGDKGTFEFKDVMPGKYKVGILNEEWCWKEKSLEVEVIDQELTGLELLHNGYVLTCSLSHDITLNFGHSSKEEGGSFQLTKGINKFCLGQPGVYRLTPKSCHQFEKETYKFDTALPTVLSLTAMKHLIEGSITTETLHKDISITIKSSANADKPTVLGPLKSDKELLADEKPAVKAKDKKTPPSNDSPTELKGPFVYKFDYWAKSGEKLQIVPSSPVLLFYPESVEATVKAEGCMKELSTFEGKKGVFIIGEIKPALKDVQIMITPGDDSSKPIELKSDDKGTYKVGPLHPGVDYGVTATKEGYIFTAVDSKQGHFKAFKLGQVSVEVVEEQGKPLQSVLLSLAGGMNYRSNNLTLKDGIIVFTSLSPGQYFLKPMMKEYKFEPVSQMIEVGEGSSVDIKVKGTRVAFSCYGKVTSLNGEAEQGIVVEANGIGLEQCTQLQEETKTEPDGNFRIRGLKPECEYEIKLKTGEVNQHIERAAPKVQKVKAKDEDISGIHIIAFRRMNQLDITGNVVCPPEHLAHLKVSLYRESNPDAPLHTTTLSKTSFFHMPSLTRDNKEYFIKLSSSLSRSMYDYQLTEINFLANKTYRHFTIHFDPKRKTLEQELSQGSFLILPLTLLIMFLSYNYQKVLPVLTQGLLNLKNVLQKTAQGNPSPLSSGTQQTLSSSGPGGKPSQYDISPELLTELTSPTKKPKKPKKVS